MQACTDTRVSSEAIVPSEEDEIDFSDFNFGPLFDESVPVHQPDDINTCSIEQDCELLEASC